MERKNFAAMEIGEGKHGEELVEMVNQDPKSWYNSMVAWWNKNKHLDKAGDMISGGLEDLGYFGGWR